MKLFMNLMQNDEHKIWLNWVFVMPYLSERTAKNVSAQFKIE